MKIFVVFALCLGLTLASPKVHHRQPKSLIDDLLDIIALIPIDEIQPIVEDHLANDGAFAQVIKYLQGPEWAALVEEVGSKPEVQDFEKFLTDAGLPVDILIALIHDAIANANPTATPDENGSLRPLLDEIEAIWPKQEILDMLNDKKENSPDFKALYERISSDEAHQLVEEVRALDEVQRLASRLKEMGVKVDEALAAVYDWLGWGKP